MSEADKQIKENILSMVSMTKQLNEGMSNIEKNLLIMQDAFDHAKRILNQKDVDKLLENNDGL